MEYTFTDSLGVEWFVDSSGMATRVDTGVSTPANLTPQWSTNLERLAPTITQKIQSQQSQDEPWWQTATRILSALSLSQQQRELMRINIERARRGEPPLDISQYAGVGVQVGVSPQTQQLLTYGGLALLAFLVFNTLARRR